jgi:hypothetical protein
MMNTNIKSLMNELAELTDERHAMKAVVRVEV